MTHKSREAIDAQQYVTDHIRAISDICNMANTPITFTPFEPTPLDTQIGGSHYKEYAIQPIEYIHANNVGFIEGSVIKYVTRHKAKGGRQDIEKAIHLLQMLIELEYKPTP